MNVTLSVHVTARTCARAHTHTHKLEITWMRWAVQGWCGVLALSHDRGPRLFHLLFILNPWLLSCWSNIAAQAIAVVSTFRSGERRNEMEKELCLPFKHTSRKCHMTPLLWFKCPLQNLCWNLIATVMILRGGTFKRRWGNGLMLSLPEGFVILGVAFS